MLSILLVIIYLAFISLGLPDSILGSAWPTVFKDLNVPVSYAGIISIIVTLGTIVSSLMSDRIIRKLKTGPVTAISVAMTALALFGFSISNRFFELCLWAIPYGLGAGAIDTALNNYVALHYKARHMSWLHSFWGVGTTIGPVIMGYCLTNGFTWNSGYRAIAIIQIVITAILVISLPLWKKQAETGPKADVKYPPVSHKQVLRLPGVKAALLAFFSYCALETTTGLWGATYLVFGRGLSAEKAASWIALYYLGITVGRFISGFLTIKLSSRNMIRIGQCIIVLGFILLLLPWDSWLLGIGLVFIGLGCAPIFPSLIHETPKSFGAQYSQAVIGFQMACAYVGSAAIPPLMGLIIEDVNVKLFPYILLAFVILNIVMVERLNLNKTADNVTDIPAA